MDSTKLFVAGSWSAYWYDGYIYSSEIARGLDVLELRPSAWLSQNEIDAANQVHFNELNVQDQPKFVWPASFAVARAYVDQLARARSLPAERVSTIRDALDRAEKASGDQRRAALSQLGGELDNFSPGTANAKVRALASVVKDLASKG